MSDTNPWKTLSTRVVYENPWIKLREDRVIRPDGKEGIYGVVDTRIATGVVALTPDHEIYLVGQWRYPFDAYSWEIPEGGSDPGESALDAARRELEEEAGIVADRWAPLGGEVHLSNCFTSEVGRLFLAEELRETERRPDPTEDLQVRRVPFDEAFDMVERGVITDAMSVIAVMRAARVLASR